MKNRFFKLLGLSMFLTASQSASAFTLAGNFETAWPVTELKFMVNTANCPAGVDVPALIEEAVKLWNQVPTSNIKLSYGGPTTSTTDSNPPTVYCATNFGAVSGSNQNETVGVGRGSPSVQNGPITSGLLILNASAGLANISNQPAAAVKVVVAHEIGHVIGLGHSQDPSALMWYTASAKTNALLSQDDVDGISYLYPRNEIGGDKMLGCGTIAFSNGGTPPPGSGLALVILFALPLALALQRRRSLSLQRPTSVSLSA